METSHSFSDTLKLATVAEWRRFPVQSLPLAIARSEWFWFGLFLIFALSLQLGLGAHRVELGNYSDEAAHFMNALVLRDYLTTAPASDPLAFAREYYLHYPKIAPLVWPPLFHVALGLFLLPGWAPHSAALVFVALIAAATARRLSTFVALFESTFVARLLALTFLGVRLIIDSELVVMVDLAVAMTALEAAWWFYRYLSEPRRRHAVLFGVWAAACCLTKGSGVAVLLLAPIAIVIARKWTFVMHRDLRVAGLIVALGAGPLVYVSYRICAAMGDFNAPELSDVEYRLTFLGRGLWLQITPAPLILSGIAGAILIAGMRRSRTAASTLAATALFALAASGLAFHVLLPLGHVEVRYLTLVVAPLIALMPLGAGALASWSPPTWNRPLQRGLLCAGIGSLALLTTYPHVKQPLGFKEIVDALPSTAGKRFFVSSDSVGEGALVTEIVLRRPEPPATVLRASKLLVDENWVGSNSRPLFTSTAATLRKLQDLRVDYVVFDNAPDSMETPYWSHMRDVLAASGDAFQPVATIDRSAGARRPIVLYRLKPQS